MALTPRRMALATVVAGALLAITGVALIFPPAALILAGLGLGAAGLLAIEVDK